MHAEDEDIVRMTGYSEDFVTNALAMANTSGGVIYVDTGIGEAAGFEAAEALKDKILDDLSRLVEPDMTRLVTFFTSSRKGRIFIKARIGCGEARPYCLKAKGLTEGVFLRLGQTTVPAHETQVRDMALSEVNGVFTDAVSMRQDLTFDYAEGYFAQKNLLFTEPKRVILGMYTKEKRYTNLALLLSDQCPNIVKAARIDPFWKFLDRKDFTGLS